MDFRERFYDQEETMRTSMDGRLANLWTTMPGIVTKVNLKQQTVEVQPAIQGSHAEPNGVVKYVNMPVVPDVPIMFPSGGGFTLTFPVKPGDHVLLHFASRCIDGWWDSGKVAPPMDKRMHDLSDAFATVGPRPKGNVPAEIHGDNPTLRSDDGKLVLELDGKNGKINIVANEGITLTAKTVNITASEKVHMETQLLEVSGEITSQQRGVSLGTHAHEDVAAGTAHSGQPVSGTTI